MSSGDDVQASVRPGDVLAGKYRVERVLGVGGMGVVVAAHHIHLNEKVALKFLLPDALGNPEATERFLREAQAAVKIKSEHVASVKDVGTLPNGAPYMVMEYLDGGDLAGWIKQRGALPIDQAVEFVIQACVAVAEAHGLRIIHRDLKPANLFCVRRADGQLSIKVLDFGISKMTDLALTRSMAMMGTPLYMSPEQMRSARDVDAGTDIWALGAILFELITGRPPFLADSIMELGSKIANDPPPALRTFRPDAPEGLEAAVFKCLEKDRALRYRNVGELALAILPFAPKRAKGEVERISGIIQAAGLSASALELPPSPQVVPDTLPSGAPGIGPSTTPGVSHTTPGPAAPRRRTGAILGGGVLAIAAVLGAAVMLRKTSERVAEPAVALPAPSPGAVGSPGAITTTLVPTTPPSTAPAAAIPSALASAVTSSQSTSAPPVQSAVHMPVPPRNAAKPGLAPQPTPVASAANQAPSPAPEPAHPPVVPKPAAPDCTTPFTIDSRGHHVPKPECI